MSLKELKAWIKWILVIIILFILILFFQCFVLDKIKEKFKSGKNDDNATTSVSSSSSEKSNGSGSKLNNAVSDFKDGYNNAETYDYNAYNFDDRILMYEGIGAYLRVETVLSLAIEDAQGTFYSRPNVRFENCANIENTEITIDDGTEAYIAFLENAKNKLNSDANFTISFEYGALHAAVHTIVITQN
jgi:hypothetical protein